MANTISQIHINDKDYDIRDKSAAPIDSPAFTGTPTAPTADTKDDSERIATTAFVQKAIKENASSNPGSGGGGGGEIPSGDIKAEDVYFDMSSFDWNEEVWEQENVQFAIEALKEHLEGINLELGETSLTAFPGDRGLALENKYEEVFQSVSNGKEMIASAITDKGIETANDATFETMANNIDALKTIKEKLNIYYGDTAPEDTNKLWIKTTEPNNYLITNNYSTTESLNDSFYVLPSDRFNAGVASIKNKIYIFGGYNFKTHSYIKDIWIFDTEEKEENPFKTLLEPDFPDTYAIAESFGTDIYVFALATKEIYKFDTITDTLTLLAEPSIPNAIDINSAHCIIGNIIYFFGSSSSSPSNAGTNILYQYDIVNNSFSGGNFLPYKAEGISVYPIGTKIYLFGGNNSPTGGASEDGIYIYDTIKNSFTKLNTTLPIALKNMGVGFYKDYLYLFGGVNTNSTTHKKSIYKFNIKTEEITLLDKEMPYESAYRIPIITIGSDMYIVSGSGYKNIDKFSAQAFIEHNKLLISSCLNKNIFKILNDELIQMEIGVEYIFIGNENNLGERVEGYLYDSITKQWVSIYES